MSMSGGSGARIQMMQHQDDSVTIVAAPVSGTKYEWRAGASGAGAALGTQKNVRIIGIAIKVTWATTQPDPLEAHLTIDGQPVTYTQANPVSAPSEYYAINELGAAETAQLFNTASVEAVRKAFLREGRSVKLECEVTWATTQPTDLTMRVKWTKIP